MQLNRNAMKSMRYHVRQAKISNAKLSNDSEKDKGPEHKEEPNASLDHIENHEETPPARPRDYQSTWQEVVQIASASKTATQTHSTNYHRTQVSRKRGGPSPVATPPTPSNSRPYSSMARQREKELVSRLDEMDEEASLSVSEMEQVREVEEADETRKPRKSHPPPPPPHRHASVNHQMRWKRYIMRGDVVLGMHPGGHTSLHDFFESGWTPKTTKKALEDFLPLGNRLHPEGPGQISKRQKSKVPNSALR
jgi:hypothetical protein